MEGLEILFLGKEDVDSLQLANQEIMDVIEAGLQAHGDQKVIMPSKDHLVLDFPEKLFNILKGYVEPVNIAGVKVIGDFHGNYQHGLPSELALVTLYHSETGVPFAIVDGTQNTWMRTGAVTAIGAKHLAKKESKVLGHIGARGTAWYNVPMLDSLFDFEEIRVTSRRPESRERFADAISKQLGKKIIVTETTDEAVRDADIIIDASRLLEHQVLVAEDAVKPGAHLQAYGAVLSVAPTLPFSVDKMVVDDWNQCQQSQYGQFADMVQAGELRTEHIYGEIGEIVAGHKPGRESDNERNLFWHKGFAISDIMLANLCYERAKAKGVGTVLPFYQKPRDM
ncbi:MAG: ornithine cyclodeaminase family protein [Chloroflexota bacterium]